MRPYQKNLCINIYDSVQTALTSASALADEGYTNTAERIRSACQYAVAGAKEIESLEDELAEAREALAPTGPLDAGVRQ